MAEAAQQALRAALPDYERYQSDWSAQPDGAVDFINQRYREFTGLSLAEVGGWRWTEVIHPADRPELIARWRLALATGQPVELEARDGSAR